MSKIDRFAKLKELCSKNNYELLSTEYIGSKTKYQYKCHCGEITSARIDALVAGHISCKVCAKQKQTAAWKAKYGGPENEERRNAIRMKRKQTCLEKYGVDTYFKTEAFKEQAKLTCLEKFGVEFASQNEEIKQKMKETVLEKYGVEYVTQRKEHEDSKRETCLEKYGIEYVTKVEEFKAKKVKTCLERFGVEHYIQTEECKERIKATNLERYGVEHASQSAEFQNRVRESARAKWGVDRYSQTEEWRQRVAATNLTKYGAELFWKSGYFADLLCAKYQVQPKIVNENTERPQSCLEKYGVEHPMQIPELFEKLRLDQFNHKEIEITENEHVFVQGYEPFAIEDILNEGVTKEELTRGYKTIPAIPYNFEGAMHMYFPDIFLPTTNQLIEVKSTYTYEKDKAKNMAKMKACIDAGYKAEIRIYSPTGHLIQTITNFD